MTTLTPAEANRLFYAEHAIDYDTTEFCANAALGQQRLRQALAPALGPCRPTLACWTPEAGAATPRATCFEQGLQPVLVDVSAEMWRCVGAGVSARPDSSSSSGCGVERAVAEVLAELREHGEPEHRRRAHGG